MFTGCGTGTQFEDYAVNEGYVDTDSGKNNGTGNGKGIAKEDIKVGVLHLTDPAEGSGYTYTHDLGIQGMQKNLRLSNDQIVRKPILTTQTRLLQEKQFRSVLMQDATLYLLQAGVIWM